MKSNKFISFPACCAHLVTATIRFVNSLAPRSGERVRERGSFNPPVVVLRCASACFLRKAGLTLLALAAPPAHASTVWTGPATNYTQPAAFNTSVPASDQLANVDQITADVWFTRGTDHPPFNAAPPYNETSYNGSTSPENTEWAFGNITDYTNLSYDTWANTTGSTQDRDLSLSLPNNPLVLHIISDDIYLSVEFSSWTHQGAGFTYSRSTPAVVIPPAPTVSITNPVAGAVFSAPATLKLGATAAVSSGTVTNVAFFAGATLLGAAQTSPFKTTSSSLAAGNYSLTAVATAAGISTTSTVVNVSVVAPVAVSNSVPAVAGGHFSFSYSANVGLAYVIQRSADLIHWSPVSTNVASSNPVHFADTATVGAAGFYRVVRQPNP